MHRLLIYDALCRVDEESEQDHSLIYHYCCYFRDGHAIHSANDNEDKNTSSCLHQHQMIVGVLRSLKHLFPTPDSPRANHCIYDHETRILDMMKCRVVDVQLNSSGLSFAYFHHDPAVGEVYLLERMRQIIDCWLMVFSREELLNAIDKNRRQRMDRLSRALLLPVASQLNQQQQLSYIPIKRNEPLLRLTRLLMQLQSDYNDNAITATTAATAAAAAATQPYASQLLGSCCFKYDNSLSGNRNGCIYADMHPELAIYCNLIASTIGDGHVIGSADGSAPSNSTVLSTIKLSACQLNKYELSESTDGDLIFTLILIEDDGIRLILLARQSIIRRESFGQDCRQLAALLPALKGCAGEVADQQSSSNYFNNNNNDYNIPDESAVRNAIVHDQGTGDLKYFGRPNERFDEFYRLSAASDYFQLENEQLQEIYACDESGGQYRMKSVLDKTIYFT